MASVECPDYKMGMQPTSASDMVSDAIDSLVGLVVDSGVELESSGAPSAGDGRSRCNRQVFGNLIENAVKYGKSGKRIEVGARTKGTEVEFYVRDFSLSIASEHIDRIFERFYRVDKARSREAGGTEAWIDHREAYCAGAWGTVRADSELGAGTTFLFTLPQVGHNGLG